MEHMTPSAPPALSSVPRSASSSSFSPSSPLTPPPPPTTSAAPTAATSSSPIALTDTLQLRRLQRSDYSKGFLPLLAQLTDVGDVSEERFGERFDAIERRSDGQLLFVIEDLTLHQVIASATLLVELKFIHNISKVLLTPLISAHSLSPPPDSLCDAAPASLTGFTVFRSATSRTSSSAESIEGRISVIGTLQHPPHI